MANKALEIVVKLRAENTAELEKVKTAVAGIATEANRASVSRYEQTVSELRASIRQLGQDLDKLAKSEQSLSQSLSRSLTQRVRDSVQGALASAKSALGFDEGKVTSGVKTMTSSLAQAAEQGLRNSAVFERLSSTLDTFGISISAGNILLAAYVSGVGVVVAKLFEFASAAGALAEEQTNVAARTGLTVKEVGLFSAVAEDAGIGAGAFTSSMRTLSRALAEGEEEGKRAKRALRELGVETNDQFGAVRPMVDIWTQMARALDQVQVPAERARIAIDILGRSGLELLPQLNAQFEKTLEEYRAMGVGFDETSAAAALGFDSALDQMTRRWTVFKQQVGVQFAEFLGFGQQTRGLDASQYRAPSATNPRGVAQLFDFEATNRQRDTVLSGGRLTLSPAELTPRALPGPTTEQLQAQLNLSIRQQINELLDNEQKTTQKLAEARKDLADAVRANNLEQVRAAQGEVRRLEGQIKSEAELLSISKQVDALERSSSAKNLDGLAKLNAEREAAIEKLGRTAGLAARVASIYDRLIENERSSVLEKALRIEPGTLARVQNVAELVARVSQGAADAQRRASTRALQESDPETFTETKQKTRAQAIEEQGRAFERQLKRSIEVDEEFIRETRKVVDALRELDDAKAVATLDSVRGAASRAERLLTLSAAPGTEATVAEQTIAIRRRVAVAERDDQLRAAAARRSAALLEAQTEEDRIAANQRYRADALRTESALRERLLDLEQSRVERILELRNRQLDEFRQTAGSIFDAVTTRGGGGLREFGQNYIRTIERTLFVNSATELARASRDRLNLAIPGQTDGQGNLNLIGRLLQGTPLGVDPAKLAAEANTNATKANTDATRQLTVAIAAASTSGAGVVGGNPLDLGGLASVISDGNGITGQGGILGTIAGGGRTSSTRPGGLFGRFFGGLGSGVTGGLFAGLRGGDRSVQLADGSATTASSLGLTSTAGRIGNVAGSVGALAGAGFGVVNGLQRGGAGGILQAVGSGLGAAALIPGPQQPFLQLGAMLTSLFGGMFGGDRRLKYDREVDETLRRNRSDAPVGSDRVTDRFGNDVDYDYRGVSRTTIIRAEVNVNTLDSRSFLDNSAMIAEAVGKEIMGGNQPLRNVVQQAAFA